MQSFKNFAGCLAILLFIGQFLALASTIRAEPLIAPDLVAWWRANAPTCKAPDGFEFPAKQHKDGSCDDGDITLFSGLLCTAGETAGCEAVRRSQAASGQWFRSPRRAQTNNLGLNNSFSHDMALGVQHYVAHTSDIAALERWMIWLDFHRVCWIGAGNNCVKSPFLRYCTNDSENGCTLRPGDLAVLGSMAYRYSAWPPSQNVADLLDQARNHVFDITAISANLNKEGFSQHLTGVEILLLRKINLNDAKLDAAAWILSNKQPKNPFFKYLSQGATPAVATLVMTSCPAKGSDLSKEKNEWSWERADSEQAWKNTMLWDCIFMADLLNNK